jgi:hypothetical protein
MLVVCAWPIFYSPWSCIASCDISEFLYSLLLTDLMIVNPWCCDVVECFWAQRAISCTLRFFCAKEARKMYRNYYIAPGILANLQRALTEGDIWGLPEGRRDTWRWLKTRDIVFFYAESPRSAVVACGEIHNTFLDPTPFFPDDWKGASKWPWRFRFQIILPSTDPLLGPGISVTDMLKFPRLKRFENLTDRQGEDLLHRCEDQWRARDVQ